MFAFKRGIAKQGHSFYDDNVLLDSGLRNALATAYYDVCWSAYGAG